MIKLSVNINKVATLRNSRGGHIPSVIDAARVCIEAGAPGITVHPRADARHIRADDVRACVEFLKAFPQVEFNMEGDPRLDFLNLVHASQPTQCTLVPVKPGELTSEAGWSRDTAGDALADVVSQLKGRGIRVSLFVDADPDAVQWAGELGADRVELYTEPFARAFERGEPWRSESFAAYVRAADAAQACGLAVNAGHDLDLDNLVMFRRLPHLVEVSIGHALISHALFVGLSRSVREYLDVLAG